MAGARAEASEHGHGAVDVLLVLALDVSSSVDGHEFDLQREGLARALLSRQVAQAIADGAVGSLAINVASGRGSTNNRSKSTG